MQRAAIDLTRPFSLSHMMGGTYAEMECSSVMRINSEPAIEVNWAAKGVGFGQAYITNDQVHAETMSRNFIGGLFNEQLARAEWSDEANRYASEECEVLAVGLDKVGDMVAFRYRTAQGVGVVYLWNEPLGAADDEGDYSDFTAHVDVARSALKSQAAVLKIILFWLEGIPTWH